MYRYNVTFYDAANIVIYSVIVDTDSFVSAFIEGSDRYNDLTTMKYAKVIVEAVL